MEIIILVGMKGSGKTTLAKAMAEQGWPTVEVGPNTLEKIENLSAAGQKHIILDGVNSYDELIQIRKQHPEEVTTIGVVVPKKLRRSRLRADAEKNLSEAEILECDRIEIGELGVGQMLASADTYLFNQGDPGSTIADLKTLLSSVSELH